MPARTEVMKLIKSDASYLVSFAHKLLYLFNYIVVRSISCKSSKIITASPISGNSLSFRDRPK